MLSLDLLPVIESGSMGIFDDEYTKSNRNRANSNEFTHSTNSLHGSNHSNHVKGSSSGGAPSHAGYVNPANGMNFTLGNFGSGGVTGNQSPG